MCRYFHISKVRCNLQVIPTLSGGANFMTWELATSLAEIIGALAVIVSLVYVGIELG